LRRGSGRLRLRADALRHPSLLRYQLSSPGNNYFFNVKA